MPLKVTLKNNMVYVHKSKNIVYHGTMSKKADFCAHKRSFAIQIKTQQSGFPLIQ